MVEISLCDERRMSRLRRVARGPLGLLSFFTVVEFAVARGVGFGTLPP
jgi:hypothetical protein